MNAAIIVGFNKHLGTFINLYSKVGMVSDIDISRTIGMVSERADTLTKGNSRNEVAGINTAVKKYSFRHEKCKNQCHVNIFQVIVASTLYHPNHYTIGRTSQVLLLFSLEDC